MLNYTRIPAPRVTLVDPQTGVVANEWFRFFNNLYTIAYAATGSVTPGTYGSATAVPQITVDDFGAILNIVNVPIAIDASQIVSGTIASARISGSYTGITGVGTLTVGTWNATAITAPYGGTGLTSYTAGDTLYYASGTALSNLAIGASTYINTSSGTAPQWTDPATITVGKATNIAGGAANRIAYQTAADTTGFIVAPTVSDTYLNWSGTAFQWSSNPLGTVTSVSVVSANGLAGTVATATTTPAITLSTTVTGLLKGNGTAISAASSGTDYAPATSGASILYGNGAGGFSNVTIGTGVSFVGGTLSATGSGGTVTSVAALTLGTTGTDLSSTVANGTTTPVITLNVPTASAANRGALSAADWTTFNGKAPGVTFTTGRVPFGQGTTTLNQNANLTWDNTNTRLGVGTSSPGYRLHVVGDVLLATGGTSTPVIVQTGGTNQGTLRFGSGGTEYSINGGADYVAMIFNTAGAERMRISGLTGNFVVGNGEGSGTVSGNTIRGPNATGTNIAGSNLTIASGAGTGTGGGGYLAFQTAPVGASGATQNTQTERVRIFNTGGVSIGNTTDPGATNLSVTGTGKFGTTVGVGAATPSTSGAGITFPATQSASTDVNTLDDYEEGTWTIGISFGGASVGITASATGGSYTKIGNVVTVRGYYIMTNKGSSTGAARITGLPFTANNAGANYSAVTFGIVGNITFSGQFFSYVNIGATTCDLRNTTLLGVDSAITNTNFANNSTFIMELTYAV